MEQASYYVQGIDLFNTEANGDVYKVFAGLANSSFALQGTNGEIYGIGTASSGAISRSDISNASDIFIDFRAYSNTGYAAVANVNSKPVLTGPNVDTRLYTDLKNVDAQNSGYTLL